MKNRKKYRNLKTSKPGARDRDNLKIVESIADAVMEAYAEKYARIAMKGKAND